MRSPKGQSCQQISDYDILFIKSGWLADKSNRPLPFVNQENRGAWVGRRGWIHPPPTPPTPPTPNDYEGQNIPWQIGLRSCLPSLPDLPGVSQYKQWSPCLTILVYFLLVYTEPLFFFCLRSHFKIKIVHFLCHHIKILLEVVT